ncbi:MAG: TolC family protein [Candidatus Omnitrophota bacterium]|nr:TolC family protein [Candidatus Omnitrophota bacterium]
MKKPNFVILNLVILVSIYALAYAQDLIKDVSLSIDEMTELALKNNFDIQLVKYDAYIKRNDLLEEESIYDTVISGSLKVTDNQMKPASTLSGTKSLNNKYELGLSKKLPTGTTLSTTVSDERNWTNSIFTTANPAHNAKAKVGIKQEIAKNFFGLIDRANVKITKIDIENSDFTSLEKIEQYLSEAQKAYWKLALKKKELDIQKAMLKKAEELYNLHKNKQSIGLIEAPEVFASEANVKERQNDVLLAENVFKTAMNDLLYKLNLDPEEVKIIPSDKFGQQANLAPVYVDALKKALMSRRDYLKEKNETEAKKIELVMKKNNLWPELNLEVTFTRNGLDQNYKKAIEGISEEDNPEYYAGLSFSLPLENSLAKSEFNKAKLEKARQILKLKSVERKIVVDIKDSVDTFLSRINAQKNSQEIAGLHEKKLAAEEARFNSGRSDTDTLIRYQEDLLTSQLALANADYNLKSAEIDLELKENTLLNKYWKEKL